MAASMPGGGDHDLRYQEYRISETTFGWLLVLMASGAGVVLVQIVADGATSGMFKLVTIVATLAAFGTVLAWAWVARTIISHDSMAVRGLLRTRTFAWPDIQDIRIEPSPTGLLGIPGPRHIVVLYDSTGRRVGLTNVNETALGKLGFTLGTEVETMRVAWQQRRGPQWAPLPRAQRKIDEYTRYPFRPWMVGQTAASLTVPVAVVILVVGLFTHAYELPAPVSWLFRPAVIGVLPAVVYPVATVVTVMARRRATPPQR